MEWLLTCLLLLLATPALAQTFPKLTGRVVDEANLLDPAQEAAVTAKLAALEQSSGRQLVVATVPNLQGYPVEDYGYRLGRAWGIGQKGTNDGVILLIARDDRKTRIEVGYGLEPYLTDALSAVILREQVRPRFRTNDFAGGIDAGVDAISAQLRLPEDQAQARQDQLLAAARSREGERDGGGFPVGVIFWVMVAGFVLLTMRRGRNRGVVGSKRYRQRGDSNWPVWLWVASEIAGSAARGSGGGWSGGGGGGGDWGGGGGGFSGGGGSFGGGGASGDW